MGTLTNFRKISPYALAIFVIVFVGFMVLSDADINTLMRQGQTLQNAEVGIVNGEKILYKDYDERLQKQIEQERSQSQNADAELDYVRLHQTIWNQAVDNVLINQEAVKMGIKVSPEEVRDELIENPPDYLKKSFTDSTGKFLRDIYLELITRPESYVKYLGDPAKISQQEKDEAVNRLRKDLMEIEEYIIRQKIYNNVQRNLATINSFVSQNYVTKKQVLDNTTIDLKVIAFRPNNLPKDEIKVDDAEIKKYYDEHKRFYEQKEQAKIKYIMFPIQPSADDSSRAQRNLFEIQAALSNASTPESRDSVFEIKFSEFGGETVDFTPINQIDAQVLDVFKGLPNKTVVGPFEQGNKKTFYRLDERREGTNTVAKASHILIKINDNKDSALAVANSLLKQAKSGKDFVELARTNSQDPGSAMNGGDLGYFGTGQMVAPFEAAVFGAKAGDIVGPVETQFGYHIIKVVDKISEEIKYSTITIDLNISNTTKNQILREAYSIMQQIKDGQNIDTLASRINKRASETAFFTKERPLFNSWYLTNMAFSSEDGEVIEPLELKNYGIILAQVTGKKPAGIISYEDKKEEIKQILIKRKQLDILKKQAEEMYQRVKGFSDLDQARSIDSTINVLVANGYKPSGVVPGLSKDAVLAQKIFAGKIGINEPIRGENGYYIVQIINKNIAKESDIKENLKQSIKQYSANSSQNSFYIWYQKVKDNAKIEDFRAKYFKEF